MAKLDDEMDEIVICKHCGHKEYYGEMRWLSGECMCRECYKQKYKIYYKEIYKWDDLYQKHKTRPI